MVERSAELVLRWSWWRRWHQAWARYYHYRRQERKLMQTVPLPEQELTAAEQQAAEQQVDVLDVVWKRLEPLLAAEKRTGRPYEHPRRIVLEAIVYVMRTNCGWLHLPSHFPPCKTVYSQYTQWRKTGIWDTIWAGLDQPRPT